MGLGYKRSVDKKHKRHLKELNKIYENKYFAPVYEVYYYRCRFNKEPVERSKKYLKRCYMSNGAKGYASFCKKISRRIVRRKWTENKSMCLYNVQFEDFDFLPISDNGQYSQYRKLYPLMWMIY